MILVVVDWFSKGCRFIPFCFPPSAEQVTEALFQHEFCCFGLPEEILFDHGPQFVSRVWKAFFKKLWGAVSLTSGYHAESNDQAECSIKELGGFLWALCHSRQHEWSWFLEWAGYTQNSLHHFSTSLMPFECVLGHQPLLCPSDATPIEVPSVDEWFNRAEQVWEGAYSNINRAVR